MIDDTTHKDALYSCIMKGVSMLVAIMATMVCTFIFLPQLNDLSSTPAFQIATIAISVLAFICLIANAMIRSHAFQRFTHVSVVLSVTAGLILTSHATKAKTTIPLALAIASILVIVAASIGRRYKGDMTQMLLASSLVVFVLLLFSTLNVFIMHSSVFETIISALGVVVFTGITVMDANVYTNRPEICKFDCCEEGSFSIFLNFSNIAADMIGLLET